MKLKRIAALIIVVSMLFTSFGTFAAEPIEETIINEAVTDETNIPEPVGSPRTDFVLASEDGGVLDSGISWSLSVGGMLSLTGEGKMDNFFEDFAPWSEYKEYVQFIYVSDGITSIGNYAFYDLVNTTSVYIPETVTEIGKGAFENCMSITEFNLPSSVEKISKDAFSYCSGISSITIPKNVTSLNNSAFFGCGFLTEILVEEGNTEFMSVDGVLYNADKTTVVFCPMGIEATSYIIPYGVTTIGEYAFHSSYLKTVEFPETLEKIETGAFYDCINITTVKIPASVTEIAQDAFVYGVDSLRAINVDENNSFYSSDSGVLYDYAKTKLLRFPPKRRSSESLYTVPDSVKVIGKLAFYNCNNSTTELSIHGRLQKIEMSAFMGYDNLTKIIFSGTELNWDMVEIEIFNEKLDEITIEFTQEDLQKEVTVKAGITYYLKDFVDLEGYEEALKTIVVSSTNPEVAVVDNEKMVAISEGETIITAVAIVNGSKAAASVKVRVVNDGEDDKEATIFLEEGESQDLTKTLSVPDSFLSALNWMSSNKKVATVKDGVVTAVGAGKTIIVASLDTESDSNFSVRCEITVNSRFTKEKYFEFENGVILKYTGPDEKVAIPDKIGGVAVTEIGTAAFSECEHVTKVEMPRTVTKIGLRAFSGCKNLTAINLHNGITFLGNYAFENCSSLVRMTIPATIENDCLHIFDNCKNLTRVDFASGRTVVGRMLNGMTSLKVVIIPATVEEIGQTAFYNCTSLETITIPDSVKTIGYSAFRNCYKLKTITLNKNVSKIGSYAFYNCRALQTASLSDSLETINDYTFYNCNSLKAIRIPDSVKKIGKYAFAYSEKMANVFLGSGITTIGAYAFAYNKALLHIEIPEGIDVIPEGLFYNSGLLDVVIPDNVTDIKKYAFWNNAKLNSVTFGNKVASIGDSAFANTALTEIAIPDSVTKLGTAVFRYCEKLKKVSTGNGINSITQYSFDGCKALSEITIGTSVITLGTRAFGNSGLAQIEIPDNVLTIGSMVFSGCTRLTDITIGSGIKNITESLFRDCTSVVNVKLSEGVIAISDYAFSKCINLKSIKIPESVLTIGSYAFESCVSLESIEIPAYVSVLNNNTFAGCVKLEEITLPKNLTSIGENCFYNCDNLESIEFPSKLEVIEKSAFLDCDAIKTIALPDKITEIKAYTFLNCENLESVYFNNNLKSINHGAFSGCSSLNNLEFPNSLTHIFDSAFSYCSSLTELTIPDTVTHIYDCAFEYCTELSEVTLGVNITHFGENVFRGCEKLTFTGGIPSSLVKYFIEKGMFDNGELNISYKYFNADNTGYRSTNDIRLGYIPMELKYELKKGVNTTNKVIKIYLPSKVTVMSDTLMLDGSKIKANSYSSTTTKDGLKLIQIPVNNNSGTITFCIKPTSYTDIATFAEMSMRVSGYQKTELIGYVNCSIPELTITVPDETDSECFSVSGITFPQCYVEFYVEGNSSWQARRYTGSTGKFSTNLQLNDPKHNNVYTVKAVVNYNGVIYTKEASILYTSDTPVLTGLKMNYEQGDSYRTRRYKKSYDLLKSTEKVQWGDYWTGSNLVKGTSRYYAYNYEVTINDKNDVVDKVYVVSTRNRVKSYLEAKPVGNGKYVTSEFFDNYGNYIPGTITVEYTKKGKSKLQTLSQNKKIIDGNDKYFKSNITEYTSDTFKSTVNISSDFANGKYGSEMTIDYKAKKRTYSTDDKTNLMTTSYNYYAYKNNSTQKIISVDLRDSDKLVLTLHDTNAGIQKTYTLSFLDKYSDGTTVHYSAENLLNNADLYLSKILKFYNLDINTDNLSIEMKKVFKNTSDRAIANQKIDAIKIKKNAFAVALMAITASGYENLSASTDILRELLKSVDEDVAFFRNWKLVNLYQVGYSYAITWKIDPSGFVYEGVTDNRLEGVTASIYCVPVDKIPVDDEGEYIVSEINEADTILWDATEYEQQNPIQTDEMGDYRWDVPDGFYWRVKYEKEGYETAYSEWMPVPPVQKDVNVGLVSNKAPVVKDVHLTSEYLTITFDKYMDPATLTTGINVDNKTYKIDYDMGKAELSGKNYADEFTVKFDTPLKENRKYDIEISGAKSYAGIEMQSYSKGDVLIGTALPSDLIIEEIKENSGDVSVTYYNNTGLTINFTTMCIGYGTDGKVVDVNIDNVYGLATGAEKTKTFTLDGDWSTYKVFTWSEEDNLHPIIESVEKRK